MEKTLRVLMLLSGNRRYSLKEISDTFNVSERTVYRYLNQIEESGFVIDRTQGGYQLLKTDYNTKSLNKIIHFSEDEAYVFYRAMLELDEYRVHFRDLIAKLNTLYDFQALKSKLEIDVISKIKILTTAQSQQKQVKLCNYHSSNSGMISNRVVEPFAIMTDYKVVWCFDLRDSRIKQFKISRIETVELLPASWANVHQHTLPFVDAFRMSSPQPLTNVQAKLSLKAYNLLKEEHPAALCCVEQSGQAYKLDIPVANYQGVGRFVLGLIDEIDLHGPQEFKEYLREKIKNRF